MTAGSKDPAVFVVYYSPIRNRAQLIQLLFVSINLGAGACRAA